MRDSTAPKRLKTVLLPAILTVHPDQRLHLFPENKTTFTLCRQVSRSTYVAFLSISLTQNPRLPDK